MNSARSHLACSVFEGRIVVSGGYNREILNTVEAYDHVGDTWENLPNMIIGRDGHKSVAVKNKLFVMGGFFKNSCEVFDSTNFIFTLFKQPKLDSKFYLRNPSEVITIGSKLFCLKRNIKIYDLENDEWSEKPCEATKNIIE